MITPELQDVIGDAIESALLDLHTALPGTVKTYDASTQTATVALGVQRMVPSDRSYAVESLPELLSVPVSALRAGQFVIRVPVAPGTTGLVIFTEAAISEWRALGREASPADIGRHTLSGAVFLPVLVPALDALPVAEGGSSDLIVGEVGGTQLRVKPGGVCEVVSGGGASADGFVAMAAKVLAGMDTLTTALSTHTHASQGAVPIFVPPLSEQVPSTYASSNLKADEEPEPIV